MEERRDRPQDNQVKVIELPEPKMTRARALAILRRRFTDAEIDAMVAGRVKITVKRAD